MESVSTIILIKEVKETKIRFSIFVWRWISTNIGVVTIKESVLCRYVLNKLLHFHDAWCSVCYEHKFASVTVGNTEVYRYFEYFDQTSLFSSNL
jgi:hypothetical protein